MSATAAALFVGGTLAQQQGANTAVRARNSTALAEVDRQGRLGDEQAAVFDESLANFERPNQDADRVSRQRQRGAAVDAAVTPTDPAVPVSGGAPKVVRSTIAKALTDALDTGRRRGKAQGALASFGDLAFDNNIDLTRSGRQQATLGGFSRGSSNILPLELVGADQEGADQRSFGQLLSSAGQLAGLAGFAGFGPQNFGSLFGRPGLAAGAPVVNGISRLPPGATLSV